jgi:hypothetical protein
MKYSREIGVRFLSLALIGLWLSHPSATAQARQGGGGLTAEYYKQQGLTSHQITRTDAAVDTSLSDLVWSDRRVARVRYRTVNRWFYKDQIELDTRY